MKLDDINKCLRSTPSKPYIVMTTKYHKQIEMLLHNILQFTDSRTNIVPTEADAVIISKIAPRLKQHITAANTEVEAKMLSDRTNLNKMAKALAATSPIKLDYVSRNLFNARTRDLDQNVRDIENRLNQTYDLVHILRSTGIKPL